MATANKTHLKQVLRDECLPALTGRSKYFSTESAASWLRRRKLRCPSATLNRYLHEFRRNGLIHDAGRGWYSSLATTFTLNREPVASLVQLLNQTFPLLDFSVWSTEQVASYAHHQLAQFVSFVHTERDNMESVAESLRTAGWTVYLHPTQQEAAKTFRLTDKTVVVRPRRDEARIAAGKVACAAAWIQRRLAGVTIEQLRFQADRIAELRDLQIQAPWSPLNRLKGGNAQAFHYWFQAQKILST